MRNEESEREKHGAYKWMSTAGNKNTTKITGNLLPCLVDWNRSLRESEGEERETITTKSDKNPQCQNSVK